MITIKQIRNSLGLSQAALADMLKISRCYYSLVESGKRPVPSECMELLEILQKLSLNRDLAMPQKSLEVNDTIIRVSRENQLRRLKLSEMEIQLNWMLIRNDEKHIALHLINKEIKIFESSESYQKQLAKHKKIIDKKLNKKHPILQQLLEMEIALLRNQIIQYDLFLENCNAKGFG